LYVQKDEVNAFLCNSSALHGIPATAATARRELSECCPTAVSTIFHHHCIHLIMTGLILSERIYIGLVVDDEFKLLAYKSFSLFFTFSINAGIFILPKDSPIIVIDHYKIQLIFFARC